HVDVAAEGNALHVVIENTGSLEQGRTSRRSGSGIGLENVRRRLDLHYPGRHSFTLEGRDDQVVATLKL
ncbi:hypothetical protein, partial [Klebsiella aerogenes]|uniref:hypothetical protein n=1 Tax=Klebsiella aerogenes TaxID=548 RepID=UPI001954B6A6